MNDIIRFVALGGLDEVGKDLYVIEVNDDMYVLEAGIKFGDRTTPGIDFIIADYQYLKKNKHRVKGYFISHGHDDQFGALPYIIKDVPAPVYTTSVTKAMVSDFCRKHNLDIAKIDFRIVEPSSTHIIGGREVAFFQTVHSVPSSFGVAILTNRGYVVYTSDFIIEYNSSNSYKSDLNALAKIAEKGTFLLINESIFANRSGYTAPKHRITPYLEKAVRDLQGRLYVAAYYQDIYRIQEVFTFIYKNHKKVVFFDQETENLIKLMNSEKELILPSQYTIDYEDITRVKDEDLVVFIVGDGIGLFDKVNALVEEKDQRDKFLIKPTDTFILATPSSSNLERLASDTVDNLYKTNAKVVYFARSKVSGMHASQEDLKMYLSLLKPKYYIPVKGEFRHLLANAQVALEMGIGLNHRSVFVLDNGTGLQFGEGNPIITRDYTHAGTILIDGLGVGDVQSNVIIDRQKLSDDGVIVMALAVDLKTRKIIAEPDIQMRGFIFVKEGEHVLKRLQQIFITEIEAALEKGVTDFHPVRAQIEDMSAKRVWRDTGRNPMIISIVEVLK